MATARPPQQVSEAASRAARKAVWIAVASLPARLWSNCAAEYNTTKNATVAGDETFTAGTLAGGPAGSTVTVGGQTYTFVAVLSHTATANEVVSSSEATGLTNLAAAVNGSGGTNYSSNTARVS